MFYQESSKVGDGKKQSKCSRCLLNKMSKLLVKLCFISRSIHSWKWRICISYMGTQNVVSVKLINPFEKLFPIVEIFVKESNDLGKMDPLMPIEFNCERNRTTRTPEAEEKFLEQVAANARSNSRQIA